MEDSNEPYRGPGPYVFLSYSHSDLSEIRSEMTLLTRLGIRFWYDAGIEPGVSWRDDIAEALSEAALLIFYVSPNSVASIHCRQEVAFAHSRGIKILAVHIADTELPLGLELNLGDQQAILKTLISKEDYLAKLRRVFGDLVESKPKIMESELKQVAVLHMDFTAQTSADEPVDPEHYLEVISECRNAVVEVIERFEGQVSKNTSGELLAYFGVPVAHDNDAERAVHAALAACKNIDGLQSKGFHKLGLTVLVRAGVQSGRVVIRRSLEGGAEVFGQAQSDAGALANQAAHGEVIVSDIVYRLVTEAFDCVELPAPNAYKVSGISKSGVPKDMARDCIGRDHELMVLREKWNLAASGSGQVVLLSGEPGIGKSRLTANFIDELRSSGVNQIIVGSCSPYYQRRPLHLFEGILSEGFLGLDLQTPADEKLSRLEDFVSRFNFDYEMALHLFAKLLSIPYEQPVELMTPEREKQLLFEYILNIGLEMASSEPLVLLIEDVHWADATTIELLGRFFDVLPSAAVFCLVNYRPEFVPDWSVRPHMNLLSLAPLTDEKALDVIRNMLSERAITDETIAKIISRADGVPLFLEEVTHSVLAEEEKGRDSVPVTLQESLASRLDQLGEDKQIAQIASVIGREFDFGVLFKVFRGISEQELSDQLASIVRKDLMVQKGYGSSAKYSFKHVLIRDAAYESLLKKDRNEYHRVIVEILENDFANYAASHPELVAYHHVGSGAAEKSIEWWMKAGDVAASHSANLEAEQLYQSALDAIEAGGVENDVRQLVILMKLVPTFVANHGYAALRVQETCETALAICEQVGDDSQTAFVLWGLWMYHVVRANHKLSLELADRLAASAEQTQDDDLLVEAPLAQGIARFFVGEFKQACEFLEKCISLYDPQRHDRHAFVFGQDPSVIALSYLSWLYWITGDVSRADKASASALQAARELGHPVSLVFALSYASFLQLYKGDFEAAKPLADELVAYATAESIPVFLAHGRVCQAWHAGFTSDSEAALGAMASALDDFRSSGSRCFLGLWNSVHAEIAIRLGNPREAQLILERTVSETRDTGESWAEPELLRVQALAESVTGLGTGIEKSMEAISLAGEQSAGSWLRRAESSLQQLQQSK